MEKARLEAIIAAFRGKRVVVIGDVMVDAYTVGDVTRVNPEAPAPLLDVVDEYSVPGGAANVAYCIAALGASSSLIGVAGRDVFGDALKDSVTDTLVKASLVVDPGRPTTVKRRFLSNGRQLLRTDHEVRTPISPEVEESVIGAFEDALNGAHGVIISDYAKGVITARVAERVRQSAARHGIPVLADAKPSCAPHLVGVTMISPNTKEAFGYLETLACPSVTSVEQAGALLASRLQTTVFLTRGKEGIQVSSPGTGETKLYPGFAVPVADVSGCGDASAAILLLSSLADATLEEMALLANAAGAVVAGKIGVATPRSEEVLAMFAGSLV